MMYLTWKRICRVINLVMWPQQHGNEAGRKNVAQRIWKLVETYEISPILTLLGREQLRIDLLVMWYQFRRYMWRQI